MNPAQKRAEKFIKAYENLCKEHQMKLHIQFDFNADLGVFPKFTVKDTRINEAAEPKSN